VTLAVSLRHRLGRITLDVDVVFGSGLTALLGPSGAGKTSVLDAIAGLLRPQSGLIRLDDDVLVDTAADTWVPPHRRRIGYMCQEPRLFPHLSVRHNLLFGWWFTAADRRRISADDVIDLLDLRTLLARRPPRLSGGEKQRVALGRALLMSPRLLLLDEPLASVDAGRKQDILPYLDRLRTELTMPVIYVTHAADEITGRAADVIVMDEGRASAVSRDVSRP
jgi:molybdate transport system ATP-binding protein